MTTLDHSPLTATKHRATTNPSAPLGRHARTDAFVRGTACGVLLGSLALVTWWWAADRGLSDLSAWSDGLVSIGRLSGLLASVLLLAQVVLMARIPTIERAFGQDKLALIHRLVGFGSFNLMVLHIVAITWGYAGGGLLETPAMLWELTWTYPGMLLAVAGTACLVMVVVTSVKAARRKLRYESWHLIHLYAYLGVGLALPHQLWTGSTFTSSTAKTVFWWSAWALSLVAVLTWRIAIPLARNVRHQLRVTRVEPEADGTTSVYMTGLNLDRFPAQPGQFLNWRFLGRAGWTRANPYSLSAAPDGQRLRITVQGAGDGSRAVADLKPGTRVVAEGPFGRLSARARTRRKIAFIGAGVGVTPLRALAEGLAYEPGDAMYVERFRDQGLFADELDEISRRRGLQLLRLGGPRRHNDSWLNHEVGELTDDAAIRHWLPDLIERDVYVCGPKPWTELVRRSLLAAGLPPAQLHLEAFSW